MKPRLTTNQAAAFADRIRPMLGFLLSCRRRLEQKGFSDKSPIYQAVDKAFDSLHTLHARLRYESCDGGVGKPREDE